MGSNDESAWWSGWIDKIISKLPFHKLTAPLVANALGEIICATCFIVYVSRGNPDATHGLIGLLGLMVFTIWCIQISKPMRRRRN